MRSAAAAGGLLSQLRALVSALRLAESKDGRVSDGAFAGCNVSALSTQLDDAAAELDALREAGAAEATAARAAAAAAEAALRLSQERVTRRDADIKTLHAKLKDARAQLVRAAAQHAACLRRDALGGCARPGVTLRLEASHATRSHAEASHPGPCRRPRRARWWRRTRLCKQLRPRSVKPSPLQRCETLSWRRSGSKPRRPPAHSAASWRRSWKVRSAPPCAK